jgi:hypothetical protein
MHRFGASSLVLLLLAACWPYGFAGGGLPSHVRTVAVLPFANETPVPELTRELLERMRGQVRARLGLREAGEARAHAVVRGTIRRYDADVPVGFSADPNQATTTAQRKLQIAVDVEIVDQTTGRTLWARKGLTADGDYQESAELSGRRQAIEKLVNDVIEGAQSQW